MENNYPGFGRAIQMLSGGDDFRGLGDKPLKSITLTEDEGQINFTFNDDSVISFVAEGDCCSRSWIEYLTVPDDIAGQTLVSMDDGAIDRVDDYENFECLQVYQTKFLTDKGEFVIIEYRNGSNGYYGGYLTRVKN